MKWIHDGNQWLSHDIWMFFIAFLPFCHFHQNHQVFSSFNTKGNLSNLTSSKVGFLVNFYFGNLLCWIKKENLHNNRKSPLVTKQSSYSNQPGHCSFFCYFYIHTCNNAVTSEIFPLLLWCGHTGNHSQVTGIDLNPCVIACVHCFHEYKMTKYSSLPLIHHEFTVTQAAECIA